MHSLQIFKVMYKENYQNQEEAVTWAVSRNRYTEHVLLFVLCEPESPLLSVSVSIPEDYCLK